jgi:hypothetical protein
MSSIATQIVYQLIMSNAAPLVVSTCNSLCSGILGKTPKPVLGHIIDVDDEKELDRLQMDRLLKWMKIIFDSEEQTPDSHREYKQELYNIYATILSDFRQYQNWKKYNSELWLAYSYRKKNTKSLATKILSDIKLFNEGLKMYSVINNTNRQTLQSKQSDTPL